MILIFSPIGRSSGQKLNWETFELNDIIYQTRHSQNISPRHQSVHILYISPQDFLWNWPPIRTLSKSQQIQGKLNDNPYPVWSQNNKASYQQQKWHNVGNSWKLKEHTTEWHLGQNKVKGNQRFPTLKQKWKHNMLKSRQNHECRTTKVSSSKCPHKENWRNFILMT